MQARAGAPTRHVSRHITCGAEDVDRGRPQEAAGCRGDAGVAPGAGEGPAEERLHEDGGRTRADRADYRATAAGAAADEITRAVRLTRVYRAKEPLSASRNSGKKRGRGTGGEIYHPVLAATKDKLAI